VAEERLEEEWGAAALMDKKWWEKEE